MVIGGTFSKRFSDFLLSFFSLTLGIVITKPKKLFKNIEKEKNPGPEYIWSGFFSLSIFLNNFFGFVITIPSVNEKKMKVENLRLDPV